jgi:hypothetical protein
MITLSVQYADQDDITEERGAVDVIQAIEAFRAFPWEEQLAEAKELQICSPSLFLKDSDDGSVFFASILLVDKLDFMLFLETEEDFEGWTLFGKRWKKKRVIYDSTGHDTQKVEAAIRAFFNDRAQLKKLIGDRQRA